MAISPASDLILDVARAADPARASATTQALAAGTALSASDGAGFSVALASTPGQASTLPDLSYKAPSRPLDEAISPVQRAKIGLESLLLKEMVEHMLPNDATTFFGGGLSGGMWRSMMAEKIADQVARSGVLKIGDRLFASHQNLLQSHHARKSGGGAS